MLTVATISVVGCKSKLLYDKEYQENLASLFATAGSGNGGAGFAHVEDAATDILLPLMQ